MPRERVRTKVRVSKGAVKPGRVGRARRFLHRWQYGLLIAAAAVASIIVIWVLLSRMGTSLPPPPE